jgi:type IV pilus assembly protein PilC
MSRFASSLSVTYAAGLTLSHAVKLSTSALGNVVLRNTVLNTVPQIQAGGQLSESIKHIRFIPDMVVSMIATGEKTGSLDATLDKVSEYYDNEAETTIEKLGWVVFFSLIVVAAIIVFFILLNFYTGYARGLGL